MEYTTHLLHCKSRRGENFLSTGRPRLGSRDTLLNQSYSSLFSRSLSFLLPLYRFGTCTLQFRNDDCDQKVNNLQLSPPRALIWL